MAKQYSAELKMEAVQRLGRTRELLAGVAAELGGAKMLRLTRFCLTILILAGLLLPGHQARATVDVTTGFVSERKTTFISLHHEDASPMPVLVAGLAQNVDALDSVFHRLLGAGHLLPSHPVLAIEISDDAYQRLLAGPRADGYAVLSLENDYRLDLDPHDVLSADTIRLGPVYRVELALWPVSEKELFALVFLLPQLSAENPRMELLAADIRQHRDELDEMIRNAAGEWSQSDLLWSPDGNLLLLAHWQNRGLSYQVFNFAADERMSLERLEHYILPPTFTPDSRFIVYSSQTELRIFDVKKHQTAGFSLREMIPGDYQFISYVEFAVNKTGDILFFDPWGWDMPFPSPNFLWRSANPEQLEKIGGLGVMEKPDLPGETWSDFLRRSHASMVSLAELAELKEETTAPINVELAAKREKLQAKYGAVYSEAKNYPRNDHLAVLIEGEDRLEARVLSLPSLNEIDTHLFAPVPPGPRPHIPGMFVGISLFNIIVMAFILLIAAGMTGLLLSVKQRYARQPAASISKKKKILFFAGKLIITLLLHFAVTVYLAAEIVDDDMGERAQSIAVQAIKQRYAEFGYTVDSAGGFSEIIGRSPLWFVDFPYQVLFWRFSGSNRFAAPMEIELFYTVFDRQGHFVKSETVRYYVMGVNRLFQSHLPLP